MFENLKNEIDSKVRSNKTIEVEESFVPVPGVHEQLSVQGEGSLGMDRGQRDGEAAGIAALSVFPVPCACLVSRSVLE